MTPLDPVVTSFDLKVTYQGPLVTPLIINDLIGYQSIFVVHPSDLIGPQMISMASQIYFNYNLHLLCDLNWL